MALTAAECDELMALAAAAGPAPRRLPEPALRRRLRHDVGLIGVGRDRRGVPVRLLRRWLQRALLATGTPTPPSRAGPSSTGAATSSTRSSPSCRVPIAHVSGLNHKRRWLHATNADHAQVTITFVDGAQATFVNSDLAAARQAEVLRSRHPWSHRRRLGPGGPSPPSPTCLRCSPSTGRTVRARSSRSSTWSRTGSIAPSLPILADGIADDGDGAAVTRRRRPDAGGRGVRPCQRPAGDPAASCGHDGPLGLRRCRLDRRARDGPGRPRRRQRPAPGGRES